MNVVFPSAIPAGVLRGYALLAVFALPASSAEPEADTRIVFDQPDFDRWAELDNFGYTETELRRFFGTPVRMPLNEKGLDRSWLKAPPPFGVHPRVLFNPDELPALRQRLKQTAIGQAVMKGIRAHLQKQLADSPSDADADYPSLVAGRTPAALGNSLAYSLMYEAFRCLVDEDVEGGCKIAAALVTFSGVVARDLDTAVAKAKPGPIDLTTPGGSSPLHDGRTVAQEATREYTLGLAYDFAHPFMTETQRDAVRSVLARATAGLTTVAGESLPARPVGASYWNVWAARALFALAAIEGEPGYDPHAYARVARTMTRYVQALFPSGDSFEAWGKNYLSLELLVLMAKRQPEWNLAAHSHVRASFNQYLLAALLPWGGGFTFSDSWGKTGALLNRTSDAMIYHALFPSDKTGDWILRQQLRDNPQNLDGSFINTRHFLAVYDALLCAIFATDFDPGPAAEALLAVTAGRPLSWFCDDSGNLITRSAWDPQALYLAYQNRSVAGGHPVADRSHFSLYSHGRVWSNYQLTRDVLAQAGPELRSVVLADGQGPSVAEARCVEYHDSEQFTLVATDLRDPWNRQSDRMVKAPAGAVFESKTRTSNELRLRPSALPWMDLPIGQLPDWYTSRKPAVSGGGVGAHRQDWYRRYEVKHAFRTAALARGTRPYALILDDLHLDEQTHDYQWGMALPGDVTLLHQRVLSTKPGAVEAEVLLGESEKIESPSRPPTKPRRLYLRILSASALAEDGIRLKTQTFPNGTQPPLEVRRLEIGGSAPSARFQVLLYPHEEGDPLPQIEWNTDRSRVSVVWPDQSHIWHFTPNPDGRTRVALP